MTSPEAPPPSRGAPPDRQPRPDQEVDSRLHPMVLFRWGVYASLGVLATLAGAAAIYTARAVLVRVLIALFVAISLDPAVRVLTRWGVRRGWAVLLIFALAMGLVAAFLLSVIPAMVDQFQALVQDFPNDIANLQDRSARFRQLSDRFNLTNQIQSLLASLPGRLGTGLLGITGRLFGVLFSVPLAFVVALCDLIPMIGATLGAVIGVLVALFATDLWPTTVLVAAFFLVYQQVENYLVAPRILRSTVNLSAAAVLLAGLIGATALGLVGALMAIPIAAAMKVVLTEQLLARERADALAEASAHAETPAPAPAGDEAAPPESDETSRSRAAVTGSAGTPRPSG